MIACYRTFVASLLDLTDNIVGGDDRAAGRTSSATTATTPTSSSPPTRAPPRSRTSPTRSRSRTASGSATRSPPAAPRATTTSAWGSPRAARGRRCGATSARSASDIQTTRLHGRRHRRHVGRRVRQRHAALASHPADRRVQPRATSSSTPTPTRARSHAERARLFALARSAWSDYDPALISPGGGVFARTAKSIPLSPQVRAALAIDGRAR